MSPNDDAKGDSNPLWAAGFAEGVKQGRLDRLEIRVSSVEKEVETLKRIAYALLGAIALVQFTPLLKGLLG